MKRLAFNGGEISPNMALRADMDVAARSCSELTNFNVAATGGITRRRGMQHLCEAAPTPSLLIPYTYDTERTYLIELTEAALSVRDPRNAAAIIYQFSGQDNSETPWSYPDLTAVTWLQLNSLLLILSPTTPVMQLRWDGNYDWSFTPFEYSTPPWQSEDLQEDELTLTPMGDGIYSAAWQNSGADTTANHPLSPGDILRASYYTERQEAWQPAREIHKGLTICENLLNGTSYKVGQKLAVKAPITYEYFICTADFKTEDFVAGCISPANYPDNFIPAEDLTGFDTSENPKGAIYELNGSQAYAKGAKIILASGYWHLYTCIRPFTLQDGISGCTSPADYPTHFMRGLQIGNVLPCGGKWEFYCSGTWYGTYSIKRNYGSGAATEPWEHMGESRSSIGSTANNIITGNEEQEECYLRLTLDTVRRIHQASPTAGWVPDICGNKLIIFPYRHNMQLGTLADGYLEDNTPVTLPIRTPLSTYDWSPAAFNPRNGYPRVATLHESRLVLASTTEQPQTLWFSRTDDLANFATGELDNDGMLLTMQTQTQAAICWLLSHANVIMLGTVEAEWVIKSSNGAALTPANAKIFNHGYRGSARIPAVTADGRVLYCERGSGRIYDYSYNYEQDGYTSSDLTIFADHIATAAGGITGGTVAKKPYCYVAYTTGSGQLLLMTYNTMHNINAWHRYTTAGRVEQACTLPNGNAADILYLITTRKGADGTETRRIEAITPESPYTDGEEQYDYTSTMETTAFSSPEANDTNTHAPVLEIYLSEPIPAESISCSSGNGYTHRINKSGTLETGWHKIAAPSGWLKRPYIGIRITGTYPCTILACQI